MAKDLTFSSEARDRLLRGSEKLAKTVGVTMGPQGKNVILGKFVGAPTITKDGVSVAREVTLDDPVEELACQLIKEASGRTASIAGDGTTTATVLAHEIFKLGNDLVSSGYSPLYFRRGIQWALRKICENLEGAASPIAGFETLRDIASISANNDFDIGEKIAEAFHSVGLDGTVAAEASPGEETSVRFVDGIELKSGYITPAFLISPGQTDIVMSKPKILICEDEITSITPFLPLLNRLSEDGSSVVLIAKDIRQEALSMLVGNNKIGRLNSVALKIPVMGVSGLGGEKEWLDCLATLCGATVAGRDRGLSLSNLDESHMGCAEKVVVNRYLTKILEGHSNQEELQMKLKVYESDSKKLLPEKALIDTKKRISFLKNKAAIITVGYSTELELKEKGDRVDDAICATRAAIEEGIVPGGGVAILRSASAVDLSDLDESLRPAAQVLIDACKRPASQIVSNGHGDPDAVIDEILKSQNVNYGYNAAKGEYEDLVLGGVIDPKKVTRTALQNAVSISLLLINTEAIVSEQKNNPSSWQPPAGWRPPSEGSLSHKQ